jgi:hypothetical protein
VKQSHRRLRQQLFAAAFSCLALTAGTARAAQGWYLMQPHLLAADGSYRFLCLGPRSEGCEPLSAWLQEQAYDSATECEAGRQSTIESEIYTERLAHGLKPRQAGNDKRFRWLMQYRCVASDDPRLRERR